MSNWFFTNGVAVAAGPFAGTELLPFDDAAGDSFAISLDDIKTYVTPVVEDQGKYSTDSSAVGFTVAAAKVAGALFCVLDLTGTLTVGENITTPTAAQLWAEFAEPEDGMTYVLRILNNSPGAFAWTVVAGTGVTVNGTATIAQNTWREFLVTLVDSTTATLQNIGGGTV